MPSKYQRKPGSRRYIDYTEAQLEECLNAVRSKLLTQRSASEQYGIPWSTIKNKLTNKFTNKPGRPTVFTETEEKSFVAHITALSEFGFPVTDFDLKMVIKDYLVAQGRNAPQFKNNVPGRDWIRSFLTRHRTLSNRLANNIKRVRAQVSEEVITEFIENISGELENVSPENIYNYDETNISDDPGRKKIICRRGTKYPEAIINATKVSFTVMFCGNAAGQDIPPYIIYKAEHLWSTWTTNGPKHARYNRTKSGWIDAATFEDWFVNHLIPTLKKQTGKKVVIGDNLSSHISPKVLLECEKHNISFICLPPNATHILQPLDVAYFRPLKCKWRQVLLDWKNSQSGRTLPTTPKEQFPRLLKKALDSMTDTKENLISGFKKTGIYPVDKEQPLSRLPRQDRIVHAELIADSFMQKLIQHRADICPEKKTIKKKKLNVAPGKSISATDLAEVGPSGQQQPKTKNRKSRRPRQRSDSSTSCSDSRISLASSTEDHVMPWDDEEDDVPLATIMMDVGEEPSTSQNVVKSPVIQFQELPMLSDASDDRRSPSIQIEQYIELKNAASSQDWLSPQVPELSEPIQLEVPSKNRLIATDIQDKIRLNLMNGDHVLVTWNSQKYPGQITALVSEEGALVSCMKRGKLFWRWPVIKDEQLYSWKDIICKINIPKYEKKGCFSVPELDG